MRIKIEQEIQTEYKLDPTFEIHIYDMNAGEYDDMVKCLNTVLARCGRSGTTVTKSAMDF